VLTASGSPLVNGTLPDAAMDNVKKVSVKVLRPFLLKLARQEAGAVIELDRRLAVELASMNKVELLNPKVAEDAAIAELKADPEPAKGKKGAGNARQ
jgi:hypothetical protein